MDELEKIIEGMQVENQALVANGEQPMYLDNDFANVTTEYNKSQETELKEVPEEEGIKEEAPQVDTPEDELLVGGILPEVEVKGEIEEKDDQSESARLMANYRLKDETNEDLYSRITPKEEVVYENIYSPINKGVIPKLEYVKAFIAGFCNKSFL